MRYVTMPEYMLVARRRTSARLTRTRRGSLRVRWFRMRIRRLVGLVGAHVCQAVVPVGVVRPRARLRAVGVRVERFERAENRSDV